MRDILEMNRKQFLLLEHGTMFHSIFKSFRNRLTEQITNKKVRNFWGVHEFFNFLRYPMRKYFLMGECSHWTGQMNSLEKLRTAFLCLQIYYSLLFTSNVKLDVNILTDFLLFPSTCAQLYCPLVASLRGKQSYTMTTKNLTISNFVL